MQKILLILFTTALAYPLSAQKVQGEYKKGSIMVDGKEVATMTKEKDKENLGLTIRFS